MALAMMMTVEVVLRVAALIKALAAVAPVALHETAAIAALDSASRPGAVEVAGCMPRTAIGTREVASAGAGICRKTRTSAPRSRYAAATGTAADGSTATAAAYAPDMAAAATPASDMATATAAKSAPAAATTPAAAAADENDRARRAGEALQINRRGRRRSLKARQQQQTARQGAHYRSQ
jgi:hypothetical protein